MIGERRARAWMATACLFGCSETSYQLYDEVEPATELPEGTPPSGGAASDTGGTSAGGGGSTEPPTLSCVAERDPNLPLIRLLTSEGLCVSQGEDIVLVDDPGFAIVLEPCAASSSQLWTLVGLPDGSWEFRNESGAMNLDVRFADPNEGTPLVLFDSHRLFNQHFFIRPGPGDTFQLSPGHSDQNCVEVRGDGLEIWPCDAAIGAQLFRQDACSTESR